MMTCNRLKTLLSAGGDQSLSIECLMNDTDVSFPTINKYAPSLVPDVGWCMPSRVRSRSTHSLHGTKCAATRRTYGTKAVRPKGGSRCLQLATPAEHSQFHRGPAGMY